MSNVYVKMSEHYTATVTEESLPSLKGVVQQHIETVRFGTVTDDSPEAKQLLSRIDKCIALEKAKWATAELSRLHKEERKQTQAELGGFLFPRHRVIQVNGSTYFDTYTKAHLQIAIVHGLCHNQKVEVVGGFDWGYTMSLNDRQPLAGEYSLVVVQ